MPIIISTAQEAINLFGEPKIAKRKTSVRIREAIGTEVFIPKYGKGNLIAVQGIDYVVVPVDGSKEYPCKIDIFHDTWEENKNDPGTYNKKELCKCIEIPENVSVILQTLEGDREVSHPNYIAIGLKGEVYSYSQEWVMENLEFMENQ